MNHTAEDIPLSEPPAWREQIGGWQQQLAAIDWRPWLIIGLAAVLRFFWLGIKPPHFDEGINGWFVDQMVHNGFYRYDPTNYHGPFHFYVLFIFQTLFGRNIWALRLPVVIVSITCVWLTLRFEPVVGTRVSRWAALAMAVSPGFVFYGRYSIHEVWMQLSSMLLILGLLGVWRFGTRNYLWCAGMGLTGMILTKETYIIHVACALLAVAASWISILLPQPVCGLVDRPRPIAQDVVLILSCLVLAAFFLPWASIDDSAVSGPHLYQLGAAGNAVWIIVLTATAVVVLSFATRSNQFAGTAAGAVQFLTIIYMCGHLPDESHLKVGGIFTLILSVCLMLCVFLRRDWTYGWKRPEPLADVRPSKQTWDYVDVGLVTAVGVILIVTFYSGTFLNWTGVRGLYQAYEAWVQTGQAGHSGHEKPWNYWLKLIARYEWPVLIGLVLCLLTQFFKNISLRYLAIYGVGTLIAYSIVHYKTPWCIISIVWPFLFVFAGATVLIPQWYRRTTEILMAVLLFISLGSSISLNYFHCSTFASDDWDSNKSLSENLTQFFVSEPYVYVQTYNDIFELTRPVLTLAKRDPAFYQMVGHMIRTSSYPLPWIFDDFPNVGYYEHDSLPPKLDADFLLVQQDRIKDVEDKLQNSYYTMPLTIRPYQDTSKLFLDAKRFKEFFPGRTPDFKGKGSG
jgi:4-amino-4-deoxy-L-arabinose transferase-like glycosyltransferase